MRHIVESPSILNKCGVNITGQDSIEKLALFHPGLKLFHTHSSGAIPPIHYAPMKNILS